MKHFVLFYSLANDFSERFRPFAAAHLKHADAAAARGELQLGGPLAEPEPRSVYVFKANEADTVRKFAENDPYFVNGLATAFSIKEWTTVVGPKALSKP